MRVWSVLSLAAVAGLWPAGAWAAERSEPLLISKRLWATINVCDTTDRPNTVGIRGSMPGSGDKAERMFMRFQLQYLRASDGTWRDLGPDGDSGFLPVGSGRFRRREAGRDFVLSAPPTGATFRVRGIVTFEWRRGDEVIRRARKRTRSHHPNTTGSDPAGFSAADCIIAAP